MACLITLFVTFLVAGVCSQSERSASSWSKLQISHRILVSMPYGNFRVNIYEHLDNHNNKTINSKKYFHSPIALLDHKSAVSLFNDVTEQNEVRFRIEMWNDNIENQVAKYLSDLFGRQVQVNQVKVVPFEKVALTSTTAQAFYILPSDWLPYQKSMWFSIQCLLRKDCDQLATDMRTNPNQFDNLKLVYSPTSQSSQTFGAAPLHDIHFLQDSTPTAADWAELVATDSDLRKELNEMKLAIAILRKELNEFKGNSNGSANPDLSDTSRRSAEVYSRRLSEMKNSVLAELRKELSETKSFLTKAINETNTTVENLRKQLAEIKNYSIEISRRLAESTNAKLELNDGYQTTAKPSTFACKGKLDGNYGDLSSKCSSKFYICTHGIAYQMNCPSGTIYRADTLQCDWPYNVPGCK